MNVYVSAQYFGLSVVVVYFGSVAALQRRSTAWVNREVPIAVGVGSPPCPRQVRAVLVAAAWITAGWT